MIFTNRQKPNIYQMIDLDDNTDSKRVELRRIAQDGEIGTPLSAESFNQFNSEKVSKIGIDTNNVTITNNSGTQYYLCATVVGTVSGDAEVVLTNCEGTITISGNSTKIYLNNCPKLEVKGINRENWGNVYRDGRASCVAFDDEIILTGDNYTRGDIVLKNLPLTREGDKVTLEARNEARQSWSADYLITHQVYKRYATLAFEKVTQHNYYGGTELISTSLRLVGTELHADIIYPATNRSILFVNKLTYERFLEDVRLDK